MPLSHKPFSPSPSIGTNPNDGDAKDGNCDPARRLTRLRKLRHLSDQDIGSLYSPELFSLPGSPELCLKSRCRRGFDHRSYSAPPQPLPLPESPLTRGAESTSPNSVHRHHPCSSLEHHGFSVWRKTVNHDAMTNTKPSRNLDKSSLDSALANAKHNLRGHIPASNFLTGNNSSWKTPRTVSYNDDSESNWDLNLSASTKPKSAPTSAVSSPITSPCRSSKLDNFFYSTTNLKTLSGKTVHSENHCPLHCPLSLNRFFIANTIEEGPQHHKFLHHVDAHPLPLPPRASSSSSQLPMLYQSSAMHHEHWPSVKGQWQKGKLIGRGTFGSVFHATNLETGASCAMKEVDIIPDDLTSAECIKQLEQEIKILRQLRHPNIVQYYGSEIVGNHLYINTEYVHPGSINKFIRDHCGAITESVVRNFTRHILSGLAYLHSNKTIHRDIKGANLLVNESGIVKLADFGLSKIVMGNAFELSLKGTPNWMAPEVVKGSIKNESNPDLVMGIDIWSLGCTIIEMFTGKPPWSESTGPSAMFKVLQQSPPIPESLSSVGKDFLQQCFQRDPADRPSAATLLKHAFVQTLHDQDVLVQPQPFSIGGPGQRDISPYPRETSKISGGIMQPSMSARIIKKSQKLIGDTSKQNNADESNHKPCKHSHVSQVNNIIQSSLKPGTLNYMSVTKSRSISTVIGMITHL
ncbi:mitogen-activated protein kinase kinase kinase 5-like isoform X2 [Abrus precatorius]|uniref:mitogen-activated protein kinase kinase kinase n=1 Tax=Abrus precatorius TaxID=3816 RepID=A0A8B8JJE9_ABRPR|nr:mitogen-activated protein kinase kinase kinase 5-like isoform X2 [Abrus precatorius]